LALVMNRMFVISFATVENGGSSSSSSSSSSSLSPSTPSSPSSSAGNAAIYNQHRCADPEKKESTRLNILVPSIFTSISSSIALPSSSAKRAFFLAGSAEELAESPAIPFSPLESRVFFWNLPPKPHRGEAGRGLQIHTRKGQIQFPLLATHLWMAGHFDHMEGGYPEYLPSAPPPSLTSFQFHQVWSNLCAIVPFAKTANDPA